MRVDDTQLEELRTKLQWDCRTIDPAVSSESDDDTDRTRRALWCGGCGNALCGRPSSECLQEGILPLLDQFVQLLIRRSPWSL